MTKKILGMGNAVLDILVETSDSYLQKNNLLKGSMTLVEQEESDKIVNDITPTKKDSGGSVANSMVGISILGGSASFCGKVKNDELGHDFEKRMQITGTQFLCSKSDSGLPTARCLVFVTPDGERTMQTFLGASTTLNESDIEENFFNDVKFLFVEGYLWSSQSAQNAIMKAVELSKKRDVKVVFSLSDPGLTKMYANDFASFIDKSVDILIGNESEFFEIFQSTNINLISKKISKMVDCGFMTQGKNGATLFQNKQFDKIQTPPVSNVVDTTGAGDMFAAGTLFKLQNNSSAQDSAAFGCKVAAKIITQFGARPSDDFKSTIQK
jgi:sugar/nucleoside kinase (ribokinase family)